MLAKLLACALVLAVSPEPMEAVRAGWVTGTLRWLEGDTIEAARFRVELIPEGSDRAVAATEEVDASGQYALRAPAPGRYRVRALAKLPRTGEVQFEMIAAGGDLVAVDDLRGAVKEFRMERPIYPRSLR